MTRESKAMTVHDHFAAIVIAQLTYRQSLRGIETCLSARRAVAYRMGFSGRVTRTNHAYANDHLDWRVFAEIASVLRRRARRLYSDTEPELGLEAELFALDATTIEFAWLCHPGSLETNPSFGEAQCPARPAWRHTRICLAY